MIRRLSIVCCVFVTAICASHGHLFLSSAEPSKPADAKAKSTHSFGIEKRIPWTTSRITGSPQPPSPYAIQRVFPKLKFTDPVVLTDAPGTKRLFLAELRGKVYSFANKNDVDQPDLFADLAKDVKGLRRVYGLTFHPDFKRNRYCYICYVLDDNQPGGTHVSRFKVTASDPPRLEPASEETIITWRSGGHNGGCLKFGPDGLLYISTGDGGPAFPPDNRNSGQDISDLPASILRIDVDHAEKGRLYSIPKDNPFVELDGARGEIWCYGLRNPWKMSFDSVSGDLWVGDVGWEMWELIYRIQRGGNYGWSLVEGPQPVHRERKRGPTPILPPTVAHSHTEARSITGGFVYRGNRLKELKGAYIYGDYVTGKIWGVRHDGRKAIWQKELVDTPLQIICFGADHAGELYLVGYTDGMIYRLIPNPAPGPNRDFPAKLSRTGLFASLKDHQPAPGVIPYSIAAEPWMDGASAERFVALPGKSKLGVHTVQNVQLGTIKGAWKFPHDAVLVKTISLEMEQGNPASRRRLETQVLHFDRDTWRAYNYIWNDDQTDAELLASSDAGLDRAFTIVDANAPGGRRRQTWHFASRTECIICHTTRAGSIHGFNLGQLNKSHDYRLRKADQLGTLQHIGLFEKPLPQNPSKAPDPFDPMLDVNERARMYLHVNCAHCHRRGGGGTSAMELPREISLKKTNLLNARPTQGTFGIHASQVLASGDPFRSVLYYRMAKLGRGRMPYFGSGVVDERGLKLIHDWILQVSTAEPTPDATAAAKRRQKQRETLKRLRQTGPAQKEQHAAAIGRLLNSTSGALMLLRSIDDKRLGSAANREALKQGLAHAEIGVRDLFERFLPEEKRVQRLGAVISPKQILALKGDAEEGRKLFLTGKGVQCRNCHRVGEQGRAIGPDFDGIGKKYDRATILENILTPSKRIDPKFLSYLVETKSGRVHFGLLVERSDKQIVLRDAQNKLITIPAADVDRLAPQQKSLMPELLVRDMTAGEVADLLAFLSLLK